MDLWYLGKTKISDEQPQGVDVKYEPEYESIENEIQKRSAASAEGGVDWNLVIKVASEILQNKSKDLKVASYLGVALFNVQEIEGLAISLRVFRNLLTDHWEGLFPPKKRMKGRMAAIEWWLEESDKVIAGLDDILPISSERFQQMKEDIRTIDSVLRDSVDEPPMVINLERFLDKIPVIEEERVEADVDESADPDKLTDSEEKSTDGSSKNDSKKEEAVSDNLSETDDDVEKPTGTKELHSAEKHSLVTADTESSHENEKDAIAFWTRKTREVVSFLRSRRIDDSRPYRLTRIAAWTMLDSLPPVKATDDRKTSIPPPSSQIQKILVNLREKQNWNGIIQTSEQTLSVSIYWLDLNRYTDEALSHVGEGTANEAKKAIIQELDHLLDKLPGLEKLCFSDGMPFADSETLTWLKANRKPFRNENPAGKGGQSYPSGDSWMLERFGKAQDLARQKKLIEAVEMMQSEWQPGFTKREQLLWRLALTQIMVRSKISHLALPHLEQIMQDINDYKLEDWDPELAIKGLKVVWEGFKAHPNKAFSEKAGETQNRIAKINPAEAIRLSDV